MKKIFNTLMFCLFIININSQLYIQNDTSKPIKIALGWYRQNENYNGYVTSGWLTVEPGYKIKTSLYFTSDKDHFYYYAKGWEGNVGLLVGSGNFKIENADMKYVKDKNPNYKWVNFKRKDVSFYWLEPRIYTLKLTE
jgi:hypothetical protein